MTLRRFALALAAASLLSCQGSGFGGLADVPVSGVWLLVPAESSIWFVGIKNNAVAVPGSFSGMEGGFDSASREGWLELRVATLATGDASRDENLRVHFFDSLQFPVARFALSGIPSADALPAVGASLATTLDGKLLIHGAEHPLSLPVSITREAAGRIRVRNAKPVVLSMKDLGLEQPLAVLKAVCGHESVSGAVPIELDVLFTPI
ncbi:MAG: YceI family protein [Myxococcota bacterium]